MTTLAIPTNLHKQVYQVKTGNSSIGVVAEEDEVATLSKEPEQVRAFCDTHSLRDYAEAALTLAKACFAPVEKLSIEVRHDPENDDEWLLVRVAARMSAEVAMNAYARYVRQWVEGVPALFRVKIRLSYKVV